MKSAYLVTGASKGLGRAIALEIAKAGLPVIAIARQSDELNQIKEILQSYSSNSLAIACDLASKSDVETAVGRIKSAFAHLSGIVHNAGIISPIGNMLDVTTANWEKLIQVNLIGVQDLTRSLKSIIGGDSHTRITTISSGAAKRSLHGWSAYCVSKAALEMWTKCMAEEGESQNISAVAIAPGIVDTDMQKEIRNADELSFPMLSNFIEYYDNGELTNPSDVAKKLLPYCIGKLGVNGERLDVRNL